MRGGRRIQVVVRLTEDEFAVVQARAIRAGLTPASYLAERGRAACKAREPPAKSTIVGSRPSALK